MVVRLDPKRVNLMISDTDENSIGTVMANIDTVTLSVLTRRVST